MKTNYEQKIDEAKLEMQKCDPCQNVRNIMQLVFDLNEIKQTYWPRPCNSGYCLGFFTPHRDRIDTYIRYFENQERLKKEECKEYQQNKHERFANERFEKQLAMQNQMFKEELKVRSEATEIETVTRQRKGVTDSKITTLKLD